MKSVIVIDSKNCNRPTYNFTLILPIFLQVSYDAFKEFLDSVGVTQSQPVPRQTFILPPSAESYYLKNLTPFTTYNINVTAKAANNDYRPPTRITVTTQMAAPRPMVRPDFYGVNTEKDEIAVSPMNFFL